MWFEDSHHFENGDKYDINKSEVKMKIFRVNFALFLIILNNYFVNFGQAESVAKVRHKITWGENFAGVTGVNNKQHDRHKFSHVQYSKWAPAICHTFFGGRLKRNLP